MGPAVELEVTPGKRRPRASKGSAPSALPVRWEVLSDTSALRVAVGRWIGGWVAREGEP